MTPKLILAVVLVCAVLAAWVRLVLWRRSASREAAGAMWRVFVLFLLQPVWAGLLFFCLFPPGVRVASERLIVATAGAPSALTLTPGARVIALPEAPVIVGAETAPDLGTALRRHPGVGRITVVGGGLTARDSDAAQGLAVVFEPSPSPTGLVSLSPPSQVAPGAGFEVGGRLSGLAGATVELLDPAGRVTDVKIADDDGRFILSGTARSPGLTTFSVRVRDKGRRVVEQAEAPVRVEAQTAPRLLILAGAPGPEVKYLRRWATDAGFAVTMRASAGGGVALGDAPMAINAAALREFDVAVIDDRSWAGLGSERAEVMAAVRGGLGLVLRSGGPGDGAAGQWRALGFSVSGGESMTPIALPEPADVDVERTRRGVPSPDAMVDLDVDDEFVPEISRLAATPGGEGTVPLLRDAGDTILSAWRAVGRGRVAVFTGVDSFGLSLTGRNALYGDWWGGMLSAVARPVGGAAPAFSGPAWVGDRVALCGLSGDARVETPDGGEVTVRTGSGAAGCAGFWPQAPGWHLLHAPAPDQAEQVWPFFVHPADRLIGVKAQRDRDATLMLTGTPPASGQSAVQGDEIPGSPWPWFIAWLVVGAALWGLERSGLGRPPAPRPSAQ
jgi:hypothetical protein